MSISCSDYKFVVENLPINVLICDKNFNITYANKKSVETLDELEEILPSGVNGGSIIGQNIDIFHKNPAHQRGVLHNMGAETFSTVIRLGPHFLELNAKAMTGMGAKHKAYLLSWSVVTDMELLKRMADEMPINVIMCDPQTLEITYINKTSIETLRPLQEFLPVKVDDLLGTCIDVFHKHPEHQRKLLADPTNLPYKSKIKLGDNDLSLEVAPIMDTKGEYMGAMVSWAVITEQLRVANSTQGIAGAVAAASTELAQISSEMSETVANVENMAKQASDSADETSGNVQSVASAAEEMSASVREIAEQMAKVQNAVDESTQKVEGADEYAQNLAQASESIGQIVQLIQDIAGQINLLALNATIESARAGEAGKGFAVVASEVKALAGQTSKATEEISKEIENMQNISSNVVEALAKIKVAVSSVTESSTAVSSAVEEQTSVTNEIAQSMQVASSGVEQISERAKEIATSVKSAETATKEVQNAADELSKQGELLNVEVTALVESS